MEQYTMPLLGGIIIAIAVSIMLLFNGRVTGISGILKGILALHKGDVSWRIAFTLGLILGGVVISQFLPDAFVNESGRSLSHIAGAGLLVGFGTAMANGCTSGHGVCGISRFSIRSLVATLTFIVWGALMVSIFHRFFS